MALTPGSHRLGPDNGSLRVMTYREGMAAKVGHDLVLEVTRWEGTVDVADDATIASLALTADARSLAVREGHRGVKPLTDRDRDEIRKNIDEKVLRGQPIEFRSRSVQGPGSDGSLAVTGDLTLGATTRPITGDVGLAQDGRLTATVPVVQSAWGIKPYRGLMGALKVRDDVEIVVDARLDG